MPTYPEDILPEEGSSVVIAPKDRPVAERGAVVRFVREGPVPKASCPHCGGNLQLSTVGSRWQVHGPKDVADQLILQLGTLEREELHVLVLNTRNLVVDQVRLYQGNVSASVVRVGELYRRAVELHASAILICHNHPSGDVTPSPDDLRLTAEALAAGRLLDIALLDHIIVGGGSYTSLRDRGIAFGNCGDHRAGEASLAGSVSHVKYLTGGMVRATYESASAQRQVELSQRGRVSPCPAPGSTRR
jgi:RadC-like JAB domain